MKSPPPKSVRTKRSTGQRRGAVLVWFAVFLFVLLPLMMMIVHLGMVTLTRRQMQTAVNSAAIEGLRFRDDTTISELERREKVRSLVSAIFDDDLNPDNGDTLRLGAGPTIVFDDDPTDIPLPGTDFVASRTIKPGNVGVYKPDLKANLGDEIDGDMVRGQEIDTISHTEANNYTRTDFRPVGDPDFDSSIGADEFLVRLRRSDEEYGPTDDAHNSGPPIPFLFGRGPYGGTDLLNRRERGTIVRATAIAQAKPVITVGVQSANVDQGLALFEIQLSSWPNATLPASMPQTFNVTLLPDGSISGDVVGAFIQRELVTLGDVTTPLSSIPGDLEVGLTRMVPIKDSIDGADRIIGFGLVELNGTPGNYSLTVMASEVVPQNAVATFVKPLPVTGADFDAVWAAFNNLNHRTLAPSLVRSLD